MLHAALFRGWCRHLRDEHIQRHDHRAGRIAGRVGFGRLCQGCGLAWMIDSSDGVVVACRTPATRGQLASELGRSTGRVLVSSSEGGD